MALSRRFFPKPSTAEHTVPKVGQNQIAENFFKKLSVLGDLSGKWFYATACAERLIG